MIMKVRVLEMLEGHRLFPTLECHEVFDDARNVKVNHRVKLIHILVKHFLRVRLFHHGKQVTQECKINSVRHKLHKQIHFKNQ